MLHKANVRYLVFVLLMTLFYGATFILIDFADTPVAVFRDVVVTASKVGFMMLATFLLLYFLGISRYLFAISFPVLTLACTALSYYKLMLHVDMNQMLLELVIVNDFRTSWDAVSWQLIALLVVAAICSVAVVVYRWKRLTVSHQWLQFIVSAILLVAITLPSSFAFALYWHTPFSILYSVSEYMENHKVAADDRPAFSGEARCDADSITVVFVLGESLRASNMQINGYDRKTTPYLSQEQNVVSFPTIYSEYGYTHTSVPYILSRADHEHPDRAYEERSFISLLKQAGYRTSWIANQNTVSTYLYFMKECDSIVNVSNGKSLFIYSKWLDEDVLPHYSRLLEESQNRQFLLVHTIGSHWYYNNHYTDSFEHFKPTINSKVISSNSHEQMVNAYDNTILYSDHIWHQLINQLRDRTAILIFLADHSECMGENGNYTHGASDDPALHNPGCFVWWSDRYEELYPDMIANLKQNREKPYNTSFLFHSILEAARVRTNYVEPLQSIFN